MASFSPLGESRMTTAARGMAGTFDRVPVMMSAVTEKPGRMLGGGSRSLTRTLKLIASEVVIRPASSTSSLAMGELPTSVTTPSKRRSG